MDSSSIISFVTFAIVAGFTGWLYNRRDPSGSVIFGIIVKNLLLSIWPTNGWLYRHKLGRP